MTTATDEVLAVLDGLVDDLEALSMQPVSGQSGAAQENRAIHGAAATLARVRAREARAALAAVRERVARTAATARAAHQTAVGSRPPRAGAALAASIDEAARELLSRRSEDAGETLALLVTGAIAAIPGADRAGISLVRKGGSVESRAPSDDLVRRLDRLQADAGQGPCVDAIRTEEPVLVPDMARAGDRWPVFARTAADRGVGSLVAFPLFSSHGVTGALNLYSATTAAFDDQALDLASLFASHAAVALHGVWRVEGLNAALRSRDVIGQAKGVLRERFGLGEEGAFNLLVRSSQDTNMKLVDVATWLLEDGGR